MPFTGKSHPVSSKNHPKIAAPIFEKPIDLS
jgi:hypothetical protein